MRKAKVVWHKDDDAVSPVIGTILMVAITVVLAAVLWLMVSGMISTSEEDKITVNFASPTVQQKTRVITCWDATININKITPKEEKVLWTEVRILVKAAGGSVLNQSTTLITDSGATYHNYTEFWFVETTSGDDKMSAGDAIKITGMAIGYEGATVELTKAGERIGSFTLDTNFP